MDLLQGVWQGDLLPCILYGILSCSSGSKALSASPNTQRSAPFGVNLEGSRLNPTPHEEHNWWD